MWLCFSVGVLFSCRSLKTKVVFSSYQALPDSLLLQFGTLGLLKESASIYINAPWRRNVLVCRELMSGHGFHGTCSIPGYTVCVGGRGSAVNECVSLCMLSTEETRFCEWTWSPVVRDSPPHAAHFYSGVWGRRIIFHLVFWRSSVGHAVFLKWSDVTSRTSVPVAAQYFPPALVHSPSAWFLTVYLNPHLL